MIRKIKNLLNDPSIPKEGIQRNTEHQETTDISMKRVNISMNQLKMPEFKAKNLICVTMLFSVIPTSVIICSSHSSHSNYVSMYLSIINKL